MLPIGMAIDGHVIWGPYNIDQDLIRSWDPCDLDICNGFRINGSYGYAATMFHPYLVGCWGPSNQIVKTGV